MKTLIAEDDFASRIVMQRFLSPFGITDIAVDGEEAIRAFNLAWKSNDPYKLLCLDIMMPKFDGHEVLRKIREYEEENNIPVNKRIRIIITSSLDDKNNIMSSFKEQCEAYLVKPVTEERLIKEIKELGLI